MERKIGDNIALSDVHAHLRENAFGEFEASIRAERQREGIDAALAKGVNSPFKGRPASIDYNVIRILRENGRSPTESRSFADQTAHALCHRDERKGNLMSDWCTVARLSRIA
jgi:hypothetical protein